MDTPSPPPTDVARDKAVASSPRPFERFVAVLGANRWGIVTLVFALLALPAAPPHEWTSNELHYFQLAHQRVAPEAFAQYTEVFDSSRARILTQYPLGFAIEWFGYEATHFVAGLLAVFGLSGALAFLLRRLNGSVIWGAFALTGFFWVDQSLFGGSWLFQGFEAKVVAYILVILAVERYLANALRTSVGLVIAATYFHFLVGGFWAAFVLLALGWEMRNWRTLLLFGGAYAVAVLPIVAVLAFERMSGVPAFAADMNLDVVYAKLRAPHHIAPFADMDVFYARWLPGLLFVAASLPAWLYIVKSRITYARLGRLGFVASCFLLLAIVVSWLDRSSFVMSKLYMFRPAALTLLLFLLGFAAACDVTIAKRSDARLLSGLRLALLALIVWGWISVAPPMITSFARPDPPLMTPSLAEVLDRRVGEDEAVLVENPRGWIESTAQLQLIQELDRPTLVAFKYVPTHPADLARWYRRLQFKRRVFAEGDVRAAARSLYGVDHFLIFSQKTYQRFAGKVRVLYESRKPGARFVLVERAVPVENEAGAGAGRGEEAAPSSSAGPGTEPGAGAGPAVTPPSLLRFGHRDVVRAMAENRGDIAQRLLRKLGWREPETHFVRTLWLSEQGDQAGSVRSARMALETGLPPGRLLAGPRGLLAPVVESPQIHSIIESEYEGGGGLVHGPMLGSVTDTTASFWVRTARPSSVRVQAGASVSEPTRTTAAKDYTAVVTLTGLEPATSYDYELFIDGGRVEVEQARFSTYPRRGEPASFRVAFGGGAGYVPSLEYMWETIDSYDPAAMLMMGDNVYIDHPQQQITQRYCYYRRQSRPEWRRLSAGTSVYAIYDDHDFAMNDCIPGPLVDQPPWKRAVWNTFRHNWVNPAYGGGKSQPGCWFDFHLADVHFIHLDGRYYRSLEDGDMLGPAQMQWLLDTLERSTATFKVIVSPVPFTPGVKPGSTDTWDGFPEQRKAIFRFIEKNDIDGVFLLAADRHRTDFRKISRPNGYDLYEFTSSRLTNLHVHEIVETPGLLWGYNEKCSFGLLRFDTTRSDPQVRLECITIDGENVHEHVLRASELR